MNVADFCDLFNDTFQQIEIWSVEKEAVVFKGNVTEVLDSNYADCEILTIDCQYNSNDVLTINID